MKNFLSKNSALTYHLAIMGANILFALNVPNIKYIFSNSDLPALAINYTRISGGAICFWIISIFLPKEKVPKRDLFYILLASLLGVQFNQLTFILASPYTSPVDISIIATLIPIITMCLSALYLKEPITWKKTLGVIIGAIGALIVILTSVRNEVTASNPLLGNILFLMSCIIFSSYLTIFKPLINRYTPITFMKWMFTFAALCQAPICLKDFLSVDPLSLSRGTIFALCFAIFGASFISYILLAASQKKLRPTVVSMYNYMQPFIVFFVALSLGQDTFSWNKIFAAILVFIGVYVVTQSKKKNAIN